MQIRYVAQGVKNQQVTKTNGKRKNALGMLPIEKRRNYRSSTRCGCNFKITFSNIRENCQKTKVIKLTKSCKYHHDNSCLPSRAQLLVEKRKAGPDTMAVNETQIKCILTLLQTNNKISSAIMRDLVRPLFPRGHSLDAQLLCNCRLKAKRMFSTKTGEVSDMTVTAEDEAL
jgi:hypothetical protein